MFFFLGHIAGFNKIKRQLQAELSDEFFNYPQGRSIATLAACLLLLDLFDFYPSSLTFLLFLGGVRIGSTDSEWAFALFLNELSKVSHTNRTQLTQHSTSTLSKDQALITYLSLSHVACRSQSNFISLYHPSTHHAQHDS